jgi:hypothetical protein
MSTCLSYLAGSDELQWAQSHLQVGDVCLEVMEGAGDGSLDLGGRGPRRTVRRDLVDAGCGGHFGGGLCLNESREFAIVRFGV